MFGQLLLAALMTVTSPDGKNTLTVDRTADGRLTYAVARRGEPLLDAAPIAINIKGLPLQPPSSPVYGTADFSAETPYYPKRSRIELPANTGTLPLGKISLKAVATNQGVAFRWELPADGLKEVLSETFHFAPHGNPELLIGGYLAKTRDFFYHGGYQELHHRLRAKDVEHTRINFLPVTLLGKKNVLCFTDVDTDNYPNIELLTTAPGSGIFEGRLRGALRAPKNRRAFCDGRRDVFRLCRGSEEPWLTRTAAASSPWRVFMLADGVSGLYANDLAEGLATPPHGDFSWVKPGDSTWEWLTGWRLDGAPFKPGVHTDFYKYQIDFAARFGISYITLDEGWCVNRDVFRVVPALNLPEVIRYGKSKGVGVILWMDSARLIGCADRVFDLYGKMGAAGFKIDFVEHNDAHAMRFMYDTAEKAARRHLLINWHGVAKPAGLQRTWPNVVAFEGIVGMEHMRWEKPAFDMARNDLRMPFVRLPAGVADYQTCPMRNVPYRFYRPGWNNLLAQGTRAHHSALALLCDTNFRILADSVGAYEREPDYTRFVASLPLHFDSTDCDPRSAPDRQIIVRKTAGSTVWIGGLSGRKAQTLAVPLDFLSPGTYTATVLRDSPVSDTLAADYILETRSVTAAETLKLPCAPDGGFLVRLVPDVKKH